MALGHRVCNSKLAVEKKYPWSTLGFREGWHCILSHPQMPPYTYTIPRSSLLCIYSFKPFLKSFNASAPCQLLGKPWFIEKTNDHIKECGATNGDTLSEGKEHSFRKTYYRKIQTGLDGVDIEG